MSILSGIGAIAASLTLGSYFNVEAAAKKEQREFVKSIRRTIKDYENGDDFYTLAQIRQHISSEISRKMQPTLMMELDAAHKRRRVKAGARWPGS
jgi:hypothetical protein